MELSPADWQTLLLTTKLASVVTVLLLLVATPLAWWLANTRSMLKAPISALVALPLVLPPTVMGFYLLVAMSPSGMLGQFTDFLGLGSLAFTFSGLVVASMLYSLPFAVQPMQNAFESVGKEPIEAALTLGASHLDAFFSVVLPLAKSGILTAAVLVFAHTVGEFGVILMIGGNIPDETRVVSVQIYEHVESLNYSAAHSLSLVMLVFSFIVLLLLYLMKPMKKLSARRDG